MEQNDATPTLPPIDAPDLDKFAILATKAKTHKISREYIKEWEGYVYIKTLTGTERDAFEDSLIREVVEVEADGSVKTRRMSATDNVRAKLLVYAICDKEGNPLFTKEEIAALGELSANGLTRAYNIASKMNAVSDADVKELAKNSGRGAIAAG
jgi:hypothetical protein